MEFQDKVYVVTGGGNGIGREVVLQLLNRGAKVVAADISENGLEETKQLSSDNKNLVLKKLDVTNKAEVDELPSFVVEQFGRVDALLNVAGIIQPFVKVNELNFDQIERVMNINFYGVLYMVKAFLPKLLENDSRSYIANVSSMGGFLPVPGQAVYGASKAAVKLLTEALYAELKNSNVMASVIFPGAIKTNITKNSDVGMPGDESASESKYKMLSAYKAASIILDGIKKEKFRIIVGGDSNIMDKMYRMNPKFAVDTIAKKMKDLLS